MHPSVHEFFRSHSHPNEFRDKDVLEVGSRAENGSLRGKILSYQPRNYLGTDMRPGIGVELVCAAEHLHHYFHIDTFDIVINTEMLEHCEAWREAITNTKFLMKTQGLMWLTCRGPGFPIHGYPSDYWRFTVDDMRNIFSDFDVIECCQDYDERSAGVFLKAAKPIDWVPKDLTHINVMKIND